MRGAWKWILLVVAIGVAASGILRIRIDTDVLSVLPADMPEAKGLKAFQEVFSRDEELVVLLQDEGNSGDLQARAQELADRVMASGHASGVRWRPRWQDDPAGLGELFAWLWMNGDPQDVASLADSLSEANARSTLEDSLEDVATALDGSELMLSAHDPFGFLDHPAMRAFFEASEHGGEGFLSEDGRSQLVFIDAPHPVPGYKEAGAWLKQLDEVIQPWAEENKVKVGYTGDPAFEAEIGGAMEGDMSGTATLTSILIGVLFLIMQRRPTLLAGMSVVLALVFLVTAGMAGWIYGDLSIMAAGFAAILLGLVVDYGVLICQEAKLCDHDARAIRGATSKSILWAAATTAAVFFALNLSGMPGISQLGTVVACGVIAGALLMEMLFVPWAARAGAGRPTVEGKRSWIPPRRGAMIGLTAVLAAAGLVLLLRGAPGVEFERSLLRPRDSAAMSTFEGIQKAFPEWGSPALKLVVEGGTDAEVRSRLIEAKRDFDQLAESWPEQVKRVDVPTGWWPSPDRIEANRAPLAKLGADRERLLAVADEVGFSEEGLGLGKMVLEAFPEVTKWPADRMPSGGAVDEILRGTVARRDTGGGRVLGTVELAEPEKLQVADLERLRAAGGEGVMLAGWALLKPAVLPLVQKDVVEVFLPMAGLMLLMLAMVFRNLRDVLAAVATMAVSGLVLLAAMRLAGLQWNFLNIAATPLLLGTGLDYGIHILLSLKRTGGHLRHVWNGTGKAVLFCGASTAIGFGSLAFASIDALASLGKVALLGILISMSVSVFLLPGLRGGRS
ncbi:MMPL family transporter [Haloferula sargassicola]|uniref:Membrane transport protein MMPL domain-containing protein n=1 Tax=Haloferula sargassicola TaxID=490096 RepID=A0ABP9UPD3_9BACT